MIKKVKNTVHWTYIINDLSGEEIVGTFYKNNLKRTNQIEFRVEKVMEKVMNYMSNGKLMVTCLIFG